jgi:predicted enzyme related to lactoylglutathione lyase
VAIVMPMPRSRPALIEFPADDPDRALRFWGAFLGAEMEERRAGEGEGWQTRAGTGASAVGVHARGPGPGDTVSLPYFEVEDITGALSQVAELGGSIVHPGERWAICRDTEGSPFGLARAQPSDRLSQA